MKKPLFLIPAVFLYIPQISQSNEPSFAEKIGSTARQVTSYFGAVYDDVSSTVIDKSQQVESKALETGQTLTEMRDEVEYDVRDMYYNFEYDLRKGYQGE